MLLPTLFGRLPTAAISPARSTVFSTRDIDSLFDTFDREFGSLLKDWSPHLDRSTFSYPYNIKMRKNDRGVVDSVVFQFALAGFSKDEISAELTGNLLTISAEKKKSANDDSNEEFIFRGISSGKSIGRFVIAREIDTSSMEASFLDGVLTVTLQVKKEVVERNTSKKIEIK